MNVFEFVVAFMLCYTQDDANAEGGLLKAFYLFPPNHNPN